MDIYLSFPFPLKKIIYLPDRVTAKQGTQAWGMREGEADFALSGEPNVGLDLRNPRS